MDSPHGHPTHLRGICEVYLPVGGNVEVVREQNRAIFRVVCQYRHRLRFVIDLTKAGRNHGDNQIAVGVELSYIDEMFLVLRGFHKGPR